MSAPAITHWLEEHGFLLCAFRWGDLPNSITELIEKSQPPIARTEVSDATQLLLLANAGPKFWRCLQSSSFKDHSDPVDSFSLELASEFQCTFLPDSQFTQLYPTPVGQSHIPLMRLGGLAGWNIPSPLGLGLHPDYGPWSAYRAAWLTNSVQLPDVFIKRPNTFKSTDITALQQSADLCVSCSAPCVTACPAAAVTHAENFQIERCYEYRRPEISECHTHCFARIACPVGAIHRYDKEQLAHHMAMQWK